MGIPDVVFTHPLQAENRTLLPLLPVEQHALQGEGDIFRVEGVNQQAILTVGGDVAGAAILSGDDRQTAGRRLDQGQTEGLGQCRIDEHAVGERCQPVDQRHVIRCVVFGVGNLAIQVVAIDQLQQLPQHLLGAVVQLGDIIPIAEHHHQIGHRL